MNILPPDHPLAEVFSVGPNAKPETIRLAEEVAGHELGETVRVKLEHPTRGTAPRYHGKTAEVVRINPADLEIGLDFKGRTTWFRRWEVTSI